MSVTVRVACAADVPVLDRHLPSGRNDVHATFVAKADVTYLAAWSGEEPCGVALIRWAGLRARDPGLAFPGAP